MDILRKKGSVEQAGKAYYTSYSLCYFNYYYSTGYCRLFYKRIPDLFSNEYEGRVYRSGT